MSAAVEADQVDVVVRFHDIGRIDELERALFSLAAQDHRPLHIRLVLQRLPEEAIGTLRERLDVLAQLPDAPDISILRFDEAEPPDARSVLVNRGFAAASGRYLALLDYDDVLYPEAYRMLIGRLKDSEAAIAFGGIRVKLADIHEDFVHETAVLHPFSGNSLADLLRHNFCPIHSFLIDRTRVPEGELRFEPFLTMEEDYEFLLRLCARVPSDFALLGAEIGMYFFKTDNSNTVGRYAAVPPAVQARSDAARHFNEGRRRITVLSEAVQRQLGLPAHQPGLTIRAFLGEDTE